MEVPPEELRVPAPHQGPQPSDPVSGRCVPTTSGHENQWRSVAGVLGIPLKGPAHGITDRFTHSELQRWSSSSKGARDIPGGTELSGFRMKAEGAAISQTEVLAESIISCDPSPLPVCTQVQPPCLSLHQSG